MEIKVGETWMQGTLEGVDAQGGGRARVINVRPVKIVCVEPCFVCVEELSKPAHPEYGHPRRWVPRGAFLGDIVLTGGLDVSAPDPKARVAGAMDRLRVRFDKLGQAAAMLSQEPAPVKQIAWAVDIIEQGRDAVTDLLELVSAAGIILYRGQEAP